MVQHMKSNMVIVQMIRTCCKINYFKYDSRIVKVYIQEEIIWFNKKILKEPLLSVVGWIYNVNPEHMNCIQFGENFQASISKIVAEYYQELDWWCQKKDENTIENDK